MGTDFSVRPSGDMLNFLQPAWRTSTRVVEEVTGILWVRPGDPSPTRTWVDILDSDG